MMPLRTRFELPLLLIVINVGLVSNVPVPVLLTTEPVFLLLTKTLV